MLILRQHTGRGGGTPLLGMTLFYTVLDRVPSRSRDPQDGARGAARPNCLFIDGLRVRPPNRIGEEGKGFHYSCTG